MGFPEAISLIEDDMVLISDTERAEGLSREEEE